MKIPIRFPAIRFRCDQLLKQVCWGCSRVALSSGGLALLIGCLVLEGIQCLPAATLPPGFTETAILGPIGGSWNEAVGLSFENNGRMYVWERGGKVWLKDTNEASFSLLLDLSEEVGAWEDHGLLGFALHPDFRINGYIYLLYVVDRHHLLHFGTPSYSSSANEYHAATIGRLTRYTCNSSDGFRSVDPASRSVLIGATKETGFPMLSITHGIGSLVFGEDETLLVSCGDGSSPFTADYGSPGTLGSYRVDALADNIIRPKEDIGAFRSQLVDCLNGKILRIDPKTGQGLPSNPFYDAAAPESARSRVWVLGLRNPFRLRIKPGSGSHHNPNDGNPGIIYIGDVGWNNWEELDVATGPGLNFGWPRYEGLDDQLNYAGRIVANLDAPNPLYPAAGCSQFFSFHDLLREDSQDPAAQPPFLNPCNASETIPGAIPQFLHTRPVLDWNHTSSTSRTPIYGAGGAALAVNVGAAGSPVSGTPFKGNSSTGGTWYQGTAFPGQYQNTYFLADWGAGWIKNVLFDQNDNPVAVNDFLSGAGSGSIVDLVEHPFDGSLYYIKWTTTIRKISYPSNSRPIAVGAADRSSGPSPLTVQFSSSGSMDPDFHQISYSWDFGDGSFSAAANPSHTFSASPRVPTLYTVTLTVTDTGGLSASTNLLVSVNNTPPALTITSPADGSLYSTENDTVLDLLASVTDAESADSELAYEWQVFLVHNGHGHGDPIDTNHFSTQVISPTGCEANNIYYYRIVLTVTDPHGLSDQSEVRIYPDCGPNSPPTISDLPDQTTSGTIPAGPIAFTVADGETAPEVLILTAASSNPTLVPADHIVLGGSGGTRTVTVTPQAGQTGTATITLTVSDGPLGATASFLLTVNPALPGTGTFVNASQISIPSAVAGVATPYPSTIDVSGLGGTLTEVAVTLNGLSHSWPDDLDMLLVGPRGQGVVIFSDAGGGHGINNLIVTLSDGAAFALPDEVGILPEGYRPIDYEPGESFPAPAPAGPYQVGLSAFHGVSPNGSWSLYILDDGPGDGGSINGGWSLTLTTDSGPSFAPTIGFIPNQSTALDTPLLAVPFTIDDPDTSVASLVLIGVSSNHALASDADIVFGGSDRNRTLTVTPEAGQIGTTTITVTVSDGDLSASTSFELTVRSQVVGSSSFTNTAPITIPAGPAGPASPYPSTIEVTGLAGGIQQVSLTLNQLSHSWPDDLDMLLVGPNGAAAVIFSDAGGGHGIDNLTVKLSDGASFALPDEVRILAEQFRPSDYEPGEVFPAPAPTGPYPAALSAFNGISPNGSWSLYILDDGPGDGGILGGGWSLTFGTEPGAGSAPTISDISDQTTALNMPAPSVPFTIGDADGPVASLEVVGNSSNHSLVADANIVFGGSNANRVVTVTPETGQTGTSTITVTVSDGEHSASVSFVLTVLANGLSGVVRAQGSLEPIAGAIVQVQATGIRTTTAADGSYSLPIGGGDLLVIVAAQKGYYNKSTLTTAPAAGVDLLLEAVPQDPNPAYQLLSPLTCATCHPDQREQWENTPMARAGLNTWVHDIYSGKGTTGGMGGFVYLRDSVFAHSNPASECASCHEPESWIKNPDIAMRDPELPPTPEVLHGISCEVCHKVANVDVAKINFPGIYPGAVDFSLPSGEPSHQVEYGLLGDVDFELEGLMRASYQPQLAAELCGACHQDANDINEDHTFSGVISEPTYLEWANSPYGDLASPLYTSCVECHMPPSGADQACRSITLLRDPSTIRSHTIEGTTPQFLDNAVELAMETELTGDKLEVRVDLTNSLTGHHVPTGVTVRNMILLVEAWREEDGLALQHMGEQTIHDLGGVGDPAQGYYAGLAGKFYAKLNHNAQGNGPTFFTDATGIQFDNRIPALATDSTSYTFNAPPEGGTLRVRARLIYRRAFRFLVDAKQWTQTGQGAPLEDVLAPHFGHLMESAEQTQFYVPVAAGPGVAFTNSSPITIAHVGTASPYPSQITVSGLNGAITHLGLTLNNLSHAYPDDIDMLLVGPTGVGVVIFSDAGGGHAVENLTVSLGDDASFPIPDEVRILSEPYRPSNYEPGDAFPAPAPSGPYPATLSAYNGLPPNGTWSLYVIDDGPGDEGSIAGGWSLTLITVSESTDPILTLVTIANDHSVILRVEGTPDLEYLMEASDDLSGWTSFGVIHLDSSGVGSFTDVEADGHQQRFYRLVENP